MVFAVKTGNPTVRATPQPIPVRPITPLPPPPPSPQELGAVAEVPWRDLQVEETHSIIGEWSKAGHGEVLEVGRTQSQSPILCFRVGTKGKPKVLITAGIHGNEHLCVSVMMKVFEEVLRQRGTAWAEALRERDIYFVPVFCIDSYRQRSRHDMGVDPNRDWSGRNLTEKNSIPAVAAMKKFFLEHRFKAAMSCHNHARMYFFPWGYVNKPTEIHQDYVRILRKMGAESGYGFEQLLRQSAPPYYGYEADWYHQHGAFSIVTEIGRNFTVSAQEMRQEVEPNLRALLVFVMEASVVRK